MLLGLEEIKVTYFCSTEEHKEEEENPGRLRSCFFLTRETSPWGCKGQGLHVVGVGVHSCLNKSVREVGGGPAAESTVSVGTGSFWRNGLTSKGASNFWVSCVGMENIKV